VKVAIKRMVLAWSALRGQLDELLDTAAMLNEQQKRIDRLRKAVADATQQSEYWFETWFRVCREFQVAQGLFVEEIDRLRRKSGEWDGRPFIDKLEGKTLKAPTDEEARKLRPTLPNV
jgi:hypothetical protein